MLKKRLVGVVTVRQGMAVQAFSYRRYLPLGKAEVVIENLDRWGVDEILIHCIDRSNTGMGPDVNLLERIGNLGLSTPLIYGGGIRNAEDAVRAINLGADRITVGTMLWEAPDRLEGISQTLGTQALIANLPVCVQNGNLILCDYRNRSKISLTESTLHQMPLKWVSEVMLSDYKHEGLRNSFDGKIPRLFSLRDKPLLLFGGLSEPAQFREFFSLTNVVAVGVGNWLNYKEHAVQSIRQQLGDISIRAASFAAEVYKG